MLTATASLWGSTVPVVAPKPRSTDPYQRTIDSKIERANVKAANDRVEALGTAIVNRAHRNFGGESSIDIAIRAALVDADWGPMLENVGRIVGAHLQGKPYHIIEHCKFHAFEVAKRNLHKWAQQSNPGGYTLSSIRDEAHRQYVRVVKQSKGQRKEQPPIECPEIMQLNHIRANGNLMRAGSRPTPTGNWLQYPRNVFYDDWFPRAETVAEEIALQTLHEMKIRRNVKPRVEGVRESIINNCATASGLTRDQTLALFRKIAWLTMWDRMEMMVDQMADYKERTEKSA